jgi:hypothetical protein
MGFTLDATSPEEIAKRKTKLAMEEVRTRSLTGMPWRYHMATHLLAGIMSGRIAAGYGITSNGGESDRAAAKRAVELADILVEELSK